MNEEMCTDCMYHEVPSSVSPCKECLTGEYPLLFVKDEERGSED